MSRKILGLLACALALAGAAPPASAHEFWLSPSRYQAGAGDSLTVAAFVGTGFRGEVKPWAAARAVDFKLFGPRTLDLRPVAIGGDSIWIRFILPDGGGVLIAYESNWVGITLPASEFDDYLKLEGMDQPLEVRRSAKAALPGRERYARCAKAWVAGTEPGRARRKAGLPLEIVPLDDPTRAGPLRVRVIHHGLPLAGALVRAWNQPLAADGFPRDAAVRDSVGPAASARTNVDGVATLKLAGSGEWLLSCVHMRPSRDSVVADWESLWASLTFARPEPRR